MSELNKMYDVIIIGAGPAGSSAGYHLAKAGIKTLIVDKSVFPRYKACGGGIIGRSDTHIPYDFSSTVENVSHEALLSDLTVNKNFLVKRDKPIVKMVMRDKFDHFMLLKAIDAGCVFKSGARIKHLTKQNQSYQLKIRDKVYAPKFIIGSDGAFGITAKSTGHHKLVSNIPALEAEIITSLDTFTKFSKTTRFDFGMVENGYGWVFPKNNILSVGVLSIEINKFNLNTLLDNYLDLLDIKPNNISRHGFKIPVNPATGNFVYDNIILTGDAAGFADPITLEGIGTSIHSGKLAAESIIDYNPEQGAVSKRYNQLCREHFLKELKYSKFMAKLIYNYPSLRRWLFTKYGGLFCEKMTDIITGEKKYSDLLNKPSNYYRLLFKKH